MTECIKDGFRIANKNLQLVFVRIAVSIINLISLIVFLGLPVVIAVIYLGIDLAQARELLPFMITNPFEFMAKYLGVMFMIGTAVIFYLTFASVLMLFALGGTLGVLKSSAVNIQYTFSLSSFFREARTNFSPLLRMLSLVFLAVIVFLIGVMITVGITAAVVSSLSGSGGTLEMFLSSFAVMTAAVCSTIAALAGLVFAVYSMVVIVIEGTGVMDTIDRTFAFLKQRPGAFIFYLIMIAGLITLNAVYYGMQIFGSVMPLFTPLIYIMNVFFQNYLAVVVWGALINYYLKAVNYPVYSSTYEI